MHIDLDLISLGRVLERRPSYQSKPQNISFLGEQSICSSVSRRTTRTAGIRVRFSSETVEQFKLIPTVPSRNNSN